MATASEIKLTEVYIGLLGRAPDPAGLAYWVDAYEKAVAKGGDPDVVLKKIMNDFTLGSEWDTGLGQYGTETTVDGVTTISYTKADADSIVNGLYENLFEKTTQSDVDVKYWSDQLQSGKVTASEMAVLMILGAGTTDTQVLGFKTEAATYYVETISADDFNRTEAKAAVIDVEGPQGVATSKAATDKIASGTGNDVTLTADDDDVTMSGGDDTVTGTNLTMNTGDTISDNSANDSDVITITGDDGFTFGTVANVEQVNVSLAKQLGGTFTIDAAKLSGGDLALTTAATVEVAGLDVTGTTTAVINNTSSDISTTGVTDLTIDIADANTAALSVSADSAATDVTVTDANDSGVTITLANDGAAQSLAVTGLDGTNDTVSIVANNAVSLDLDGVGGDADLVTLSGNTNDVTYTIADAPSAGSYTLAGSKSVTVSIDSNDLGGNDVADSLTAGTSTVEITGVHTAAAMDLTGVSADVIEFATTDTNATSIQFNDSADITLSAGQDAFVITQSNGNDGTAEITLSSATTSFADVAVTATEFAAVKVNAGDLTVTGVAITASGSDNDSDVTVVGTNDISGTTIAAGDGTVTVSGKKLTFTDVISGSGLVDIDSTNDVNIDGVEATKGSILIDATGDITSTEDLNAAVGGGAAGNDVVLNGNTLTMVTAGKDEISGDDITIDMANDTAISSITGSITAANDVVIKGGNIDVTDNIIASAGDVTISDTADVSAATIDADMVTITGASKVAVATSTTSTGGVTITSSCDVDLGAFIGTVVNGSAASGAITIDATTNITGPATLVTGSGNDVLTLSKNETHEVQSGEGADTITITTAGNDSVINAEGGDDIIAVNDATDGRSFIVNGGDGNDTVTLAAATDHTVDGGDGTDTLVLNQSNYADDTVSVKNFEKMIIAGGDSTEISAAQFANENTFELSGAHTLNITAQVTTDTVIDASNLTFDLGAVADLNIDGNAGEDTLTGSAVIDVITGGAGNDIINGGGSADTLNGGDDNDILNGGAGNDIVNGNADNDTLNGNENDDTLNGGTGVDTLDGGSGVDIINGDEGNDILTGGSGVDTFTYTVGDGVDTHVDFTAGVDKYDNSLMTSADGADLVITDINVDTSAALVTTANAATTQVLGATLSASDASDITKVIAAISNGTITVAASDVGFISVVTTTGATYLYSYTDGGNTALDSSEITFIGIFDLTTAGFTDGDLI